MDRDLERWTEFMRQAWELDATIERIDTARDALEDAERYAEPQYRLRIAALRRRLGELKTDLNNEKPGYVMKQAGAAYQVRSGPDDRYGHESQGSDR